MFLRRLLLSGLVLLNGLADARAVHGTGFIDKVTHRALHDPSFVLKARQSTTSAPYALCRAACGSGCTSSCSASSAKKRSLIGSVSVNATSVSDNLGLNKRVIQEIDQEGIDEYLAKTGGTWKEPILDSPATSPNSNALSLDYTDEDGTQYTYAAERVFANYHDDDTLRMGTPGLVGCTVLTIVSDEAVYMAHLFESLAFDRDDTVPPATALRRNFLNLIRERKLWRSKGTAITRSLYKNKNTKAYIMTPKTPAHSTQAEVEAANADSTRLGYPEAIATISQTLVELIGELDIVVVGYEADDDEDLPAHRGIALFEYDANADGRKNGGWRLWYEQNTVTGGSIAS